MKRFKYILYISLIYTLLFSVAPLVNDNLLLGIKGDSSGVLIRQLIFLSFLNFSIFYLVSLNRVAFKIFLPVIFFLSGMITFYIYSLNITFSYRTIVLLLETNVQTFKTVINYKVLVFSILCVAFALVQILYSKRYLINLKQDKFGRSDGKVIALLCAFFLILNCITGSNKEFLPQSIFYSFYEYFEIFHGDTNRQIPKKAEYKGDEDLVVFLVIGESIRGDKFSLNGYGRETNPELKKLENILSYKDFTSCEVLSIMSLPCLLTNRSVKDPQNRDLNLPFNIIFSNVGFETYWVNEHFHGLIESEYEKISTTYEKSVSKGKFATAAESLESIASILAKPGKKLVSYHSFLSHWPYSKLYPEEFQKWSPVCSHDFRMKDYLKSGNISNQIERMKKCDNRSLHNEYDNSIFYFDHVVNEIVKMLKDKNAILLITSDHGESLGEGGYYLHGGYENREIKEQKDIPFIVWFSDKFLEYERGKEKFANAKARLNSSMNHDYIFHSLLDCADIESGDIDKSRSICR